MARNIAFYLVLVLFAAGTVQAQEYIELEDHYLYGHQCTIYLDGRVEDSFVLIDKVDGTVSRVPLNEMQQIAPAIDWSSLVVSQIVRWPSDVRQLEFSTSGVASRNVDEFNAVLGTYFNRKRGTDTVVKIKVTDRDIAVDLEQDENQFIGDGENTIVITTANDFIGEGVGAYVMTGFDASGNRDANNEVHTKLFLGEADAFFRNSLFSPGGIPGSRENLIVHEFGHAIGYSHTLFHEDPMSYNPSAVNLANLDTKPKIVKMRDRLYHDEATRQKKQLMLGHVIDLGFGTAPSKSAEFLNTNNHHPFALTTIGGADGNPIEISAHLGRRVTDDNLIVTVSGESHRQRFPDSRGFTWVFDYEAGLLFIGNKAFYNKMKSALEKNGVPKWLDGVKYDKAIYVIFEARGFLSGDGKPASIRRGAWVVDTGR